MSTAPNDAAAPVNELCQSSGNIVAQHLGFTAKEAAAIALRVPDSGNDWLDSMIRTAQRNDLAKAAMQPIIRGLHNFTIGNAHPANNALVASIAFIVADAMLSGAQIAEGE